MMAIVGGNLADIDSNVTKLEATGATAETSGKDTAGAATVLAEAIEGATAELLRRFEEIASTLDEEIRAAATKLETSEWEGHSKRRAVEIKGELQGQVNSVMGQATQALNDEKAAFTARANNLVDDVNTQFQGVMTRVQAEYTDLAAAARRTRENFATADQTIM